MEVFFASLQAISILIGLGVIGFVVIARKIVPEEILKLLSSLAIDVAVPLLVFTNIIVKFDPTKDSSWWTLPLWWAFFAAVTLIMTVALGRCFMPSIRQEAVTAMYLNNPTFVPLSILIGIYGANSSYIADLFLFTMFSAAFYFNFYKVFFNKKSNAGRVNWNKIFNPILKATVLALILKLTGIGAYIPQFVLSITGQIGDMSFPLIMMILGGNIYQDMKKSGPIYLGPLIKYLLIKNILFPLIILGILYFIRPPFPVALILLLQAAAPPLTTVPVLIEREGGNMQIANQFVVASFIFAIISIPLMMTIFNRLF